ncbi:manganese efflux pump MntP [Bordetella sp. BOR01]|uniref:manganese efflux pump MntP n=1 Tax=Bordetella sp. BOR01 TaxID=2854779 RepID=UPI001C469E7C|nr:manganese efflux pump MntP [Bordetella sp. BOR01]MBV7482817.1 manganese efflux pump MntP [Bordetella sp. BOR01]
MNFVSTMILALAMSTDAFAAAVGKGTALRKPKLSDALRTGLIFGVIEAITPLVGWALGSIAAGFVADWDHWIAFCLLCILGAVMIRNGLRGEDRPEATPVVRHSFWLLAATGFATSIDAMAVGVSLAFIDNNILITAAAIGLATLVMVTLGVMVGRLIGRIAGKWAEVLGGLALMSVGSAILYEHLGA